MNTQYTHLTQLERESIMILLSQGKKQADIAKILNRSPSTIYREVKRRNLGSYSAYQAQQSYE